MNAMLPEQIQPGDSSHFTMRSCWIALQGQAAATVEGSDIPVVPKVINDAHADQEVRLEPRRSTFLTWEKSHLETDSEVQEGTMRAVREKLFAFCNLLVSEGVHFITLRGVRYYASSLLLEPHICPDNSVLLVCASRSGSPEEVVVKFTCDVELAGRELEVGRSLGEQGLHVAVAGSKRSSLKGFGYAVGYSVTRRMRHGDLAHFLEELGEDLYDFDAEVVERARQKLLRRCVKVGCDVIPQLKKAHRGGWLHCDVKPNNIFVGEAGALVRYRLADWDHSVKMKDAAAGGRVAGTEHYEGPEVESGGRIGPKLDVFGLGATLFYVCAGVPPQFKNGKLKEEPKWIPGGLLKLLSDMMVADPEKRPGLDECMRKLESMKGTLQ